MTLPLASLLVGLGALYVLWPLLRGRLTQTEPETEPGDAEAPPR